MEGAPCCLRDFCKYRRLPNSPDVHSADEIVAAATAIAPSFGGINLEDIAAPICFEVAGID